MIQHPGGELTERQVGRRSLLKGALAAGVATLGASTLIGDRPSKPYIAGSLNALARYPNPTRELEHKEHHTGPWLQKEQLMVAGNPLWKRGFKPSRYAVAAVHAGFFDASVVRAEDSYREDPTGVTYEDARRLRIMTEMASGKRGGDYADYTRRIKDAYARMGNIMVPTMCHMEQQYMYRQGALRPEFKTPHNSIVAVTANSDPRLEDKVVYLDQSDRLGSKLEKQDPSLLYDALRDAGVETVVMAGEYTFDPYGTGGRACLGGTAAAYMEQGFNVAGIEGAVYPQVPPPNVDRKDPVFQSLYVNTVSL